MHLKQIKRNGRVYLSVVQNYREGGATKTRTVETIGYADQYAHLYADPIAHFKGYVDQLNEGQREENSPIELRFARNAQIEPGDASTVHLGLAIALSYLEALGACAPFEGLGATKRIFELLASTRMMHAVPKHATWQARDQFPRTCPEDYAQVYQALPQIAAERDAVVRRMNDAFAALRGPRATDHITLVFSNYVFAQVINHDSDASGVRDDRMARLCVVVDSLGIPLDYRIVPARLPTEQIVSLVESVRTAANARRVVMVAGLLPQVRETMEALVESGNGFVFFYDVSNGTTGLKEWIAKEDGYQSTKSGSFRIKSRIANGRIASDGTGENVRVKEIALWSRSHSRRAPEGNSLEGTLCIVSSETERSEAAIFNLYRELWRVHEPFQVIDADFISPPALVSDEDHLSAHFLICFAAFFALRVLRMDMDWRYNAAEVADALLQLTGAHLTQSWYLFTYRDDITDAVEAAAGIDIGRRVMSKADIRHAIAQAKRHIARKA